MASLDIWQMSDPFKLHAVSHDVYVKVDKRGRDVA